MKSVANLALVIGGLRAEAEDLRAKLSNLGVMVAERARLRSAASRTGNLVPVGGKRHTGTTSKWIGIEHRQPWPVSEVDVMTRSRNQR